MFVSATQLSHCIVFHKQSAISLSAQPNLFSISNQYQNIIRSVTKTLLMQLNNYLILLGGNLLFGDQLAHSYLAPGQMPAINVGEQQEEQTKKRSRTTVFVKRLSDVFAQSVKCICHKNIVRTQDQDYKVDLDICETVGVGELDRIYQF